MSIICALALLLCVKSDPCMSANTSKLIEHTYDSLTEKMPSGKVSFIYFGSHVNQAIELFLEQLELSADALEDYGISVAKVNCSRENVEKFCTGGKVMKKAYLFRGSEVLRSFDIDTVFDVNAIVSHVLFTVLFNEVRYVHTVTDLLNVERAAKGKIDIVFGHIQVLGLPEHRALMEAAFVYGTKYQFVLTTGGPVLKHVGVEEPSSLQTGLWFLHCKDISSRSEPCPYTALRKPLTIVNIHTFLQLMEAPLVTETRQDPPDVDVIHRHLNIPVLFLFSQTLTQDLDRATAESLAWRLRGEAGVVLIHRESPDVKTSLQYNAAYQLAEEVLKYFTLKSIDEAVKLFREKILQEEEEIEEEEEEDAEEQSVALDALDDEVAESVYRDRDLMLDLEPIRELTSDTFNSAVTQNGLTVVLFYLKWDAVSMAFIQSCAEVSDALEDVSDIELASVDCGEWTDLCGDQKITSFPAVVIYRPGDPAVTYRGMLGAESLHRFLLLSQVSSPLSLSSHSDLLSFMEGEIYDKHSSLSPVRVLGLFRSAQDPGITVFVEASRILRGEVLMGIFTNEEAEKWVVEHSVKLPAMLVSRGPGIQREAYSLNFPSPERLVTHIQHVLSDPFPELTIENLPWYLERGKPLLLLFVGGDENSGNAGCLREIGNLLKTGQLESYVPCWIHLGRTPAGSSVLETYLGVVPPLPALVLSRLGADGEVFHFPPERPLLADTILQWLREVENGREQPAGMIPNEELRPSVGFYDFLAIMDREVPGYAAQRIPRGKSGAREGRKLQPQQEEQRGAHEGQAPGASLSPGTPHQHSEL
ncbi:thioredoxin domain-containing protein 16 [Chanos chanos]|uniref:Thioredoxin domain-containing protein 16 n=1 Tax=Chanos chanos TaxID=29144 RepID=A0A6J2VY91_CHACN|nr:thioredoxin domain-containing protein 16 [Chanos chanos]